MKIIFGSKKNNYKGNLHCHTTLSDGTHTKEEIKDVYKRSNYDFVAYSDHDTFRNLSELNDESFLALPSVEVKAIPNKKLCEECGDFRYIHMQVFAKENSTLTHEERIENRPAKEANYESYIENANEMIKELVNRNNLVTVNHPDWSQLNQEDLLKLEGYFALEIYNSNAFIENGTDGGEATILWDELLLQGKKVFCFAADDNHNARNENGNRIKLTENDPKWPSCKGYVVVNAENLNQKEITEALESGNYYSSTKPEIHKIFIEDGFINVECSKVNRIDFVSRRRRGETILGTGLTNGKYKIIGDELYVRIVITDENGNKAWANPIFKEDLV